MCMCSTCFRVDLGTLFVSLSPFDHHLRHTCLVFFVKCTLLGEAESEVYFLFARLGL